MTLKSKIIYKRILIKFSGEYFKGDKNLGIDMSFLNNLVFEIKELLISTNIQISIVIGGGNFFRGEYLCKYGVNRIVADHMGMLATIINSLAMRDALTRASIKSYIMSAIPLNGICDNYSWEKAISLLEQNYVVIFSAGTGNPLFTTDSAACLRGIEIGVDLIMKATKVDGVYSSDPIKYCNATFYEKLTYQEVLDKKIKIMDITAFILARDHNIPICVFNMKKKDAIKRIIRGEKEGTLII